MQVCVFEFMNKSLFFPSDMWSSQHSHYKAQKGNCLCECSSRKVLNKNQSYLPFTNMTEYKAFKMCSPERYKAILILINLMLIGKHTDEGCCLCFFFVCLFGFFVLGDGRKLPFCKGHHTPLQSSTVKSLSCSGSQFEII